MTISLMVVDDQTLVREGIKSLLSEASDGQQALDVLRKASPDVVLMDIQMPKLTGIECVKALQEISEPPPVIMLTTFDDHQLVLEAIQAGAKGYLLKDVSLETLIEGIETVHGGERLIQPAITERVIKGLQGKRNEFSSISEPESLSEKEREILRLMASGCSNKEISQLMFKSEGTVKNQVSNVLSKLGVRDRTRAVLKALELGLI
jgi:DNA-binding NarL/FixJ family response regulator